MNYNKGIEDGKKSQSLLWILSGFITLIGILLVLFKNKNPKTDGLEDEYIKGYKKGVIKRRWLFFIIGLVLSTLIINIVGKVSNDENSNPEITTEIEMKKRNTIIGTYYQKDDTTEWVTEIKDDETYVYKIYESGEEEFNKMGTWSMLFINDQFNSVKKSNKTSTEYKILVFDNKSFLVIDDQNCLKGSSKKLSGLLFSNPEYNLLSSDSKTMSSFNILSPITLGSYETLCYDEELTNEE